MTTAGAALAVSLAPLVIGVLLAKAMATDPLTPVNALITKGGQAPPLSPAQWRGCGARTLRGWRGPLGRVRRIKAGQDAAPGAVHGKAPECLDSGAIPPFRQRGQAPCQTPRPRP